MSTYLATIRRFDRDIINYFIFNSALTFAFPGTLSVLVNLYLVRLGYDTAFIGGMLAAGMVTWGTFALPAGTLGARIGVKRAIIISMVSMAVFSLLIVLAGFLPEPFRAPCLVVCWMMLWGAAALISVNSLPYMMAITSNENRSYVLSLQQVISALVILGGSLLSGLLPGLIGGWLGLGLDHPLPYQLTLLLTPTFYLVAGLVFLRARNVAPTAHAARGGPVELLPLRIFAMFALIVVLQSASDGAARNFFNIYLDKGLGMPVAQIGAIMGFSQLLPVVISLVIPLIMARIGTRGTMFSATLLSSSFILVLASVSNGTVAGLAFMGFSGMGVVNMIARSIFSQEIVSQRWRTITSALATIGIAAGWAVSAWLGGSLIASIGYRGLFLGGTILALFACLFIFLYGRLARGRAIAGSLPLPVEEKPI